MYIVTCDYKVYNISGYESSGGPRVRLLHYRIIDGDRSAVGGQRTSCRLRGCPLRRSGGADPAQFRRYQRPHTPTLHATVVLRHVCCVLGPPMPPWTKTNPSPSISYIRIVLTTHFKRRNILNSFVKVSLLKCLKTTNVLKLQFIL